MCSLNRTLAGLLLALFTADCYGEYLRICYMSDWSHRRDPNASFTVSNIDVSLCTHVILAFASIQSEFNSLTPLDPDDAVQGGTYQQLAELRDANPGLKVILAVGGWKHGSEPFVDVVSTEDRMDIFVSNIINYIRAINFDGVDIDWEWPTQRGSNPEDKQRFSTLLEKLRERIDAESVERRRPALLLSIAVGASKYIIDSSYEIDRISNAVDFMSVMTYDMNLSRGSRLLHHAPLYSRPGDPEEERENSVQYSINYWLNKGAPRSKIIMGLPFYGRFYKLLSPLWTKLYDNAAGPSDSYSYYQICQFLRNSNWTRVFDSISKVPHIYNNDEWIGYDDPESIKLKAMFIREKNLGGAMIWDMGQDDFNGTFCNQGRFPLLSKVTEVLTSSKDDCSPGTYGYLNASGCTLCPRGTYQPKQRQITCLLCGQGKTTYREGVGEEYRCVESCPVGKEFNYADKTCAECPLGYIRSHVSFAYCQKCPVGYTTMTTGSVTCVQIPDGVEQPEILFTMYHFTLKFDTVKCDNKDVIVGAVTAGIWRVMSDASIEWSELCTSGCDNVKTVRVEGCEEKGGSRRRRRRNDHPVTLTVKAVVENVPEALNSGNITRPIDSIMTELFFDKNIFNTLEVYDIKYSGLTSRTVEKLCNKTGIVFIDGKCVPCAPGSHRQTTTRRCAVCSAGQYQDVPAQDECKACPGPTSTTGDGADSLEQCLSPCTLNTSYCENSGTCHWNNQSLRVRCLCVDPYYGDRCQKILVEDASGIGPIIGGIIGGLGSLVFIVLVMVVCCLYQRRDKTRPKYNSNDVMFVPSVMSTDYLQTPTIISADPYYFENTFAMSRQRDRNETKTPKIIELDSETPPPIPKISKTNVTRSASNRSEIQITPDIRVTELERPSVVAGDSTCNTEQTTDDSASVMTTKMNKFMNDAKSADKAKGDMFLRL